MLGIKAISDVNLKVKKLIIIKKQRIWNIYFISCILFSSAFWD